MLYRRAVSLRNNRRGTEMAHDGSSSRRWSPHDRPWGAALSEHVLCGAMEGGGYSGHQLQLVATSKTASSDCTTCWEARQHRSQLDWFWCNEWGRSEGVDIRWTI